MKCNMIAKIGIDGGAVFGGALHGIVWHDGKIEKIYSIKNTKPFQSVSRMTEVFYEEKCGFYYGLFTF